MKVWKVTFTWLTKESGTTFVIADHAAHSISKALAVEKGKGCLYKDDNVLKTEFMCDTEDVTS